MNSSGQQRFIQFNINSRLYTLFYILWAQHFVQVNGFTGLIDSRVYPLEVNNVIHTSCLSNDISFSSPRLPPQIARKNIRPKLFLFNQNNNEDEPYLLSMIEDKEVLCYDIFLLINLFVAISCYVTHRASPFLYINEAISSGSLFSLCWIFAGIYHGTFLFSSTSNSYKAGTLALTTFISTCNIRLVLELLIQTFLLHQKIEFDWLEFVAGLALMASWRWLHSVNVNK